VAVDKLYYLFSGLDLFSVVYFFTYESFTIYDESINASYEVFGRKTTKSTAVFSNSPTIRPEVARLRESLSGRLSRLEQTIGKEIPPTLFDVFLFPFITSCTMVTGSFPGRESGRGVKLTPHPLLVPKSKNRVELYLFSP
jgi:hypothetical protein